MPDVKPGWTTTQFWLTLLALALPLLVQTGLITPADSTFYKDAGSAAITSGGAFLTAAVSLVTYTITRYFAYKKTPPA